MRFRSLARTFNSLDHVATFHRIASQLASAQNREPRIFCGSLPDEVVGTPIFTPAGQQLASRVIGSLTEVPMARKRHSPVSIAAVLRRVEAGVAIVELAVPGFVSRCRLRT